MRIATLPAGDPVHRYDQCLVVPFAGARRVLSTSPMNGGYREDLTAVFNNDMNPGPGMACRMLAEGQESVTGIGHACGLGSTSYFSKIFHARTGCTPLEYRRKWQDNNKN